MYNAEGQQANDSSSKASDAVSDIIILVIGPVGAGKSTFVNAVRGRDVSEVNHSMGPVTKNLCSVPCDFIKDMPKLAGHRLVLLDTPGFDNPNYSDAQIWTEIENWLQKSYTSKAVVGGVLYVYDISNKILNSSDKRIFQHISKNYGRPGIRNTIFATTNWGPPAPPEADSHLEELKTKYWHAVTDDGPKIYR